MLGILKLCPLGDSPGQRWPTQGQGANPESDGEVRVGGWVSASLAWQNIKSTHKHQVKDQIPGSAHKDSPHVKCAMRSLPGPAAINRRSFYYGAVLRVSFNDRWLVFESTCVCACVCLMHVKQCSEKPFLFYPVCVLPTFPSDPVNRVNILSPSPVQIMLYLEPFNGCLPPTAGKKGKYLNIVRHS